MMVTENRSMKKVRGMTFGILLGCCLSVGLRLNSDSSVSAEPPLSPARNFSIMESATSAEADKEQEVTVAAQQQHIQLPAFVNIMKKSGLGSQLLNMFARAMYLSETQNRTLIADESVYPYCMNATTGFLLGFFTPLFPVVDTPEQYSYMIQPYLHRDFEYRPAEWDLNRAPQLQGSLSSSYHQQPLVVTMILDYRKKIRKHYRGGTGTVVYYEKMVQAMCPHLQFNAHAQRLMADFRQARGVTAFDSVTNTKDGSQTVSSSSVAFHVRRGDKIIFESRKYEGSEYVQQLLKVAQNTTLQDCFVATDSYQAVDEIRAALIKYNITCHLWTLTPPSQQDDNNWLQVTKNDANKTHTGPATLEFLSQLDILIRATYFVGTFNSNVGALVTVLRGCHQPGRDAASSHYFDSYGVDRDTWYTR